MSAIVFCEEDSDHGSEGDSDKPLILVAGATGSIGGRWVRQVLERGYRVQCLVRSARKLESRTWRDDTDVDVVQGDLSDRAIWLKTSAAALLIELRT